MTETQQSLLAKARACRKAKMYHEALEAADKAFAIRAGTAALRERARIFVCLNQLGDAKRDLDRALNKIDPRVGDDTENLRRVVGICLGESTILPESCRDCAIWTIRTLEAVSTNSDEYGRLLTAGAFAFPLDSVFTSRFRHFVRDLIDKGAFVPIIELMSASGAADIFPRDATFVRLLWRCVGDLIEEGSLSTAIRLMNASAALSFPGDPAFTPRFRRYCRDLIDKKAFDEIIELMSVSGAADILPRDETFIRLLWRCVADLIEQGSFSTAIRLMDALANLGIPRDPAFTSRFWRFVRELIEKEGFGTVIQLAHIDFHGADSVFIRKILSLYCGGGRQKITFAPEDEERLSLFLYGKNTSTLSNNSFIRRMWLYASDEFPTNAQFLRQSLKINRSQKRYRQSLLAIRQLRKIGASNAKDRFDRVDLLNRLGRTETIERYARYLQRSYDRNPDAFEAISEAQWVAHRPSEALATLESAGRKRWQHNAAVVHTAVRCLASLRRYVEANDLLHQSSVNASQVPDGLVRSIRSANEFLSSREIHTDPGQDAAIEVARRWFDRGSQASALAYEPIAGRIMLSAFSLGVGGSERQVTALAKALSSDSRTESVHIVYSRTQDVAYSVNTQGGRVSTVSLEGLGKDYDEAFIHDETIQEIIDYGKYFGLANVIPILRALHKLRPQVAHVRGGLHAEVALASILSSTPRVLLHFGSMTRGFQATGSEIDGLRQRFLEFCCQKASARPNVVLTANSAAAAADWARELQLPEQSVGVLYNGLDEQGLGFAETSGDIPNKSDGNLIVGGVFRFDSVKDPLLWIDVAAKVAAICPTARFLLIGDGPLANAVRGRIDKLGLSSRFDLPGLVHDGLASYYRRMDVFLLTSKTESLPNVVIEAQLAGVPIVAPNIGGLTEAIANENTAYITDRRLTDLAAAVVTALEDEQWRNWVRATAPEIIRERFSLERMLKATRSAYGWSA